MRNVSHYISGGYQNTLYVQWRDSDKHTSYEIMWKYMAQKNSPCWLIGAKDAHSESEILIAV